MNNISKYLIPMDELDMSLLSLNRVRKKEAVQKQKYFDFEKKDSSDSDVSGTNDSDTSSVKNDVNINNCVCYICNIQVPEIFMNNHINSLKHKTYLKIADTALKRVGQFMKQNIPETYNISSLYFCDVCVIAVDDERNHVLSDSHKIAVKRDKMFNSLVELYIDDNCEIKHDYKTEFKDESSESSDDELNIDVSTYIKRNTRYDANDFNKDEESGIEQEIAKKQIDVINSIVKNHTIKPLDENHYIINIKDAQIKVERNNYHSFKKVGKRKYLCQLCSCLFQRKGLHLLSVKHLHKISTPIIEHHCIREGSTRHCILCNERTEGQVLHRLDPKHVDLLKNAIIVPDKKFDVNESESKVTLNNMDANEKLDIILDRANELKVSDNRKTVLDEGSLQMISNDKLPSIQPNNDIPNVQLQLKTSDNGLKEGIVPTNIPSTVHDGLKDLTVGNMTSGDHPDCYMIKTINQEKSCYFCNVQIPNTTRNILEHLNGTKHKQTVSKLLNDNKLVNRNGLIYCEFCNIYVNYELQYYHIQLESHKENKMYKNLNELVELVKFDSDNINQIGVGKALNVEEIEFDPFIMEKTTDSEMSCKICNVIVPYKKSNIQEHIERKKHKNNLKVLLEKNKIMIKQSRLFCELCYIYIKDKMGLTHLNSYFHKIKMEIDDANMKMKTTFTYILNMAENETLFCKICNTNVPNSESHVMEHIDGTKHKFNETETFISNKIVIKDLKSYCQVCSLNINGLEHQHIETTYHKEKINTLNEPKSEIKTDEVKSEIENPKKCVNLDEYFGIIRTKPHVVRCTVCDVDVPESVNNLDMHVGGTKHKSKLKISQ